MSLLTHPSDDALQAFAMGEVMADDAVPMAMHIDACPRCAARVASADPLAHLWAAVPEHAVPEGLEDRILDAAASGALDLKEDRSTGRAEPLVAVALMAASALLMVAFGQPTELVTDAALTARAAGAVASPASALAAQLPWLWAGLGAVGLAVSVVVAQRRELREAGVISALLAASLAAGVAWAEPAVLPPADGIQVEAPAPADHCAAHEARVAALEARLEALEGQASTHSAPTASAALVPRSAPVQQPRPLTVGGTTVPAGEEVDDAVAMSGPLDVYGTVLGDAVGLGGDVRIHDGGRVLGDAVSVGGEVDVDAGGEVLGDRVALGKAGLMPAAHAYQWGDGLVSRIARRLASLLSLAAAGVLLIAFWPQQIARIAETARQRPFWHGLAGGILSGVLGLGALLLTLTILGLPLAAGLVLVLGLAWLLGFVGVCLAIGQRLPASSEGRPDWVVFLAGAGVVALVSLIPFVGPLALGLIGFEAVGAALISRFGNRGDPDDF